MALSAEASVRSALREWQPSMKLRGVSLSFFPHAVAVDAEECDSTNRSFEK
jgi:hypothetical protein